ncbi:MAG: AI-2E family transporter [Planctomycetota bacterium]|nr:AI-2E family transporter [Planctomycetota bacterium]
MEPHHQRIQTFSLLTIAAVTLGAALNWLTPVMVPFMLAFFFTVVLTPVVEALHRKLKLPRLLALFLTGVLGLVIAGLLGALVAQSVAQLDVQVYVERFIGLRDAWAPKLGLNKEALTDLKITPTQVNSIASGVANGLLGILSQLVLVMIFMMFLVSGRAYSGTLGDVEQRIKGYVMTKVVVSSITGVLTWLVLMLLGIEMAIVFGLLAFLLNFIPSIGSIIATVMPLPIVLGGDYELYQQVGAILIPGVIQFSVGNLLEPRMLGDSMDLHPVTILLALIFWGMIWGFVGTLLATPITAVVRILLDKLPETRPVAELMAGRMSEDPVTEPDPDPAGS